jgi:hypothetical protein
MGDTLRKVQVGDPLAIPASTFNSFIDAARDFRARQTSATSDPLQSFRQAGIVPIKNGSTEDRNRFDVLGISAPLFSPTDNIEEFKNRVSLTGVKPAAATHLGKFAILLEPMKDGAIGRACVSGVCPARIYIEEEWHQYADVEDDQPAHLKSRPSGGAHILWKESGAGAEKMAIVRVGTPSPDLFIVLMQNDGGVAGDDATDCSFTYSIFRLDDTEMSDPLAEALVPKRKRLPLTTYIAAADSTWGLATFQNETWSLLDVYEELPDTSVCETESA